MDTRLQDKLETAKSICDKYRVEILKCGIKGCHVILKPPSFDDVLIVIFIERIPVKGDLPTQFYIDVLNEKIKYGWICVEDFDEICNYV